MLKFFIDIEGTVLDDLKSRNFLTFNCSQIAKLIADRTNDNQDYRDAMIIDRFVDLTIYVVRQGNLDRRQLPDIEQLYREKKFNNMAIVLNGVSHNRSSYGYGYGYGYGYSYNYYYNEDKEYSVWHRRWHKLKGLFKKRH